MLTPCLQVVLILSVGGSVNSLFVVIFMKISYLKELLVICIIYSFQYGMALFNHEHAKRGLCYIIILSRVLVTIDGVRNVNCIY
jgi:hypothetical protein